LQALGDFLDFAFQRQGFRRGLQFAAYTQKQRKAQLQFGVLQHFGHRRLRDVQQLRGGTDRASLANGLEDFDMTQAHGRSITFVYR